MKKIKQNIEEKEEFIPDIESENINSNLKFVEKLEAELKVLYKLINEIENNTNINNQ